ncbi:MAG: hypothetical protein K0S70_70 [Microbacterium sp.]|jgi:hypothetical protein|nr:hypothetical protein [Microbacterium sp.]
MSRRLAALTLALTGALALIAGVVVGTLGEAAQAEAIETATVQEAFDEGFAAGAEYERWFCTNTVTPAPSTPTTEEN